jgi:hypothetical protein
MHNEALPCTMRLCSEHCNFSICREHEQTRVSCVKQGISASFAKPTYMYHLRILLTKLNHYVSDRRMYHNMAHQREYRHLSVPVTDTKGSECKCVIIAVPTIGQPYLNFMRLAIAKKLARQCNTRLQ